MRNPIRIQLSPEDKVSKNVDHYMLEVEMDDKRFFLERLINENKNTKILVFVRTKVRADRVAIAMKRIGIETLVLHGDIAQNDRLSTISAYRDGICDVLIATDVSARGIDIPNVQFVVNYDVPTEADTYVHRVGRTGRGMSKGMAFTFCSKEEGHLYEAVEDYLGRPVKKILLDQIGYSEITQLTKSKTLTISAIADEIRLEKQKKKKK